ncbi:MAG TPA: SymE family type I addiction module toxin [Candidatus Acidoferrum sp.]|nr:SymE family type I addiction module toxin [Candidatus Acidoferrum sp.]
MKTRTLKIEKTGDFFHQKIKPALRLKGRWLEQAGFTPDSRALVVVRETGILEIRAIPLSP